MRNTVEILGVKVDNVTMEQAVDKVREFLSQDKACSIYTPNAEIMMAAQRDPSFKDMLNNADLLVPDGAGVVLASRILGLGLPEKVAGVDLVRNIFSLDMGRKIRFYFYGSKPGVAEEAAERIHAKHPSVEVVGCTHGYITSDEKDMLLKTINESNADVLLVALGGKKQEEWIDIHKDVLKVKVCIGVGGSLDIFAGKARLAPEFFRRNGLEWLYRLYKEPKRFIRMLDLPRYVLKVVGERIMRLFTRA